MTINESYLDLVAEECAEVIQVIMKIKRFGLHNSHPTYHDGIPNWQALAIEMGDLQAVMEELNIPDKYIWEAIKAKRDKLKTFGPDGTYLAERDRT